MAVKDGKTTTEWTALKWIMTICGILGAAMTSVIGALVASGTLEQNSTVAIVLGGVVAVLTAVGGVSGGQYIKGRSAIKAAEAIRAKAETTPDP